MEYLKCNTCGHLNILKTKYQVLCSECKKKLENNFSDWQRNNPNKNFEDFKKIECISEQDILNAQAQKKSSKTKKGAKYWIGLIATIIAVTLAANLIDFSISDYFQKAKFNKAMMEAASQINESCPIMIDSETRLDNSIALPEDIFQYNYTLINYTKEELDIKVVKSEMEPNVINFVKTNPEMKYQRENKWTIKYNYRDKNGIHLFVITITPDMYKMD